MTDADPANSSADRLRLALHTAGIGLWELDLQTRALHVSPGWRAQLGYDSTSFANPVTEWVQLVHPEDRDRVQRLGTEFVARGKGNLELECRLRHRNGTWRAMLARLALTRDAAGQPTHLVGCNIDISRRKRAEDALRASEERYRRFIETIPHLAWRCTPDGLTIDCNRRWYEYTGQSPDEAFATGWQRSVHPDDLQRTQERIAYVVTRGIPYQTEYRLRRASDGLYRWHVAHALPLRDADGQIVEWFGSAADIDDQKRAEQELRHLSHELERRVQQRTGELTRTVDQLQAEIAERQAAEAALRSNEERFRQIAENIRGAFWLSDPVLSKILYLSPGYEQIWGRKTEWLMANPDAWLETIHPEDRDRTGDQIRRWRSLDQADEVEYRILRPDGAIRWVRNRAFPIRDARGRLYRVAGLAEDITERKELEQVVLDITSHERQRIGQDLHDGLCQQIAGVALMVKALQKGLGSAHPNLVASTTKIEGLLNQCLVQARELARGLCVFGPEGANIQQVLRELAASSETLFDITCQVRGTRSVPIADPDIVSHLYHIVQEAISNAVRHGRADRITLDLHCRRGSLELAIEDNGTGFDPARVSAKGLGLRLMHYRARILGGRLDLQRTAHGMRVTCSYPLPAAERSISPVTLP